MKKSISLIITLLIILLISKLSLHTYEYDALEREINKKNLSFIQAKILLDNYITNILPNIDLISNTHCIENLTYNIDKNFLIKTQLIHYNTINSCAKSSKDFDRSYIKANISIISKKDFIQLNKTILLPQ